MREVIPQRPSVLPLATPAALRTRPGSEASQVLRACPTSLPRSLSAYVLGLPDTGYGGIRRRRSWDLPLPARRVSYVPGVCDRAGSGPETPRQIGAPGVPCRHLRRRRHPEVSFFRGAIPGAHVPCQRLRAPSRATLHDSAPWCVPNLRSYDSFIYNTSPVFRRTGGEVS